MNAQSVVFYYDVVCPFAYMASRLVEALGRRTGAQVVWKPVLLGGIYELTQAPQGRDGSATDVMPVAKLRIQGEDLHRQMSRYGVPYRDPVLNPQRTVYAMRILAGIHDNQKRISLSHALYRAYWCEQRDVGDHAVLREVAAGHGVDAEALSHSDTASQQLRANTAEVAERGGFGVPSFYVNNRLYWGTDRMFFVERALGHVEAAPERLIFPPSQGAGKLSFYFDFSSPWSYVGFMRLTSLAANVAPVQLKVEYIPILLGALFKEIGRAMVPATTMPPNKLTYYQRDLQDWCDYAGVELNFPDAFPLRTVTPLRVTLASKCDPELIRVLYLAAWRDNRNIGEEEVCREVLLSAGFDADHLLQEATTDSIKRLLFQNTSRAVSDGLCGVPTYKVNNSPQLIWGQDKQHVVEDLLCGWHDPPTSAKL